MITLCMDTSHTMLALSLIDEDKILGKCQMACWKKQSEELFPQLEKLMAETNLTSDDIDAVCISEGPGSYTGVRIAMTVGKVFAAMRDLPLYTVGTLQLYAGCEECLVLLDARGGRAYTGVFKNGEAVDGIRVAEVNDICRENHPEKVVGDGHLIGVEDNVPDLAENFLALKKHWKKAENVHLVVPEYLKNSESYLVKK